MLPNHRFQDSPLSNRPLLKDVESLRLSEHHLADQRDYGVFKVAHPCFVAGRTDTADFQMFLVRVVIGNAADASVHAARESDRSDGPIGPAVFPAVGFIGAKDTA